MQSTQEGTQKTSAPGFSWEHEGVVIDPSRYVTRSVDGIAELNLIVENIECAACVQRIEKGFSKVPAIKYARVNFTTSRLVVRWDESILHPIEILTKLKQMGFDAKPFDPSFQNEGGDEEDKDLLKCLGVAGFAAANVMLISVSVWAGLVSDMGEGTRGLFHWLSALIALPAVAYAGRPFFKSALKAVRAGHVNMDVPISLAVILASAMSIAESFAGAEHVFFDAAVMLLFFLLIGRYLDRRARSQAKSAAQNLLSLRTSATTILDPQGNQKLLPINEIEPGMIVLVSAGSRMPVDGVLEEGRSTLDTSMVTGESLPREVSPGEAVYAGTMNLSAPVSVRVTKADQDTLLSEIVRLMENAEESKASYVRLADRAAQIYAPAVHGLALISFLAWWLIGGVPWQDSLFTAIAVLIITCPCALGLAVPVVQVVAVGQLLKKRVLVKAAEALERLANIDTVVFDKTGTLTTGELTLMNRDQISVDDLTLAARLALASKHPLSRALVREAGSASALPGVEEFPGQGLMASSPSGEVRLGNREWCSVPFGTEDQGYSEIWLKREGKEPVAFYFKDQVRPAAARVISGFQDLGMQVELLSGDREAVVAPFAKELGIENWKAEAKPQEKISRLEALRASDRQVLMVGDGINDAPALAAASVSLSPSSASDVSQAAADFIFQGGKLEASLSLYHMAVKSKTLIFQNFALAFVYNLIAIPLAMLGYVTPLVAALAMSGSSLVVTGNAMRLYWLKDGEVK